MATPQIPLMRLIENVKHTSMNCLEFKPILPFGKINSAIKLQTSTKQFQNSMGKSALKN